MKDDLEKFAEENRGELDAFEPRAELWEHVESRLHLNKRVGFSKYYVAAAAIILLLAGAGIFFATKRTPNVTVTKTEGEPAQPELKKTEVYYASVIEEKRSELNAYCKQQPALCTEFGKELDTLNTLYGQLKQEYNGTVNKEVVLQAMIYNLQTQLDVLSQQLRIIQNIKAKKEVIKTL